MTKDTDRDHLKLHISETAPDIKFTSHGKRLQTITITSLPTSYESRDQLLDDLLEQNLVLQLFNCTPNINLSCINSSQANSTSARNHASTDPQCPTYIQKKQELSKRFNVFNQRTQIFYWYHEMSIMER